MKIIVFLFSHTSLDVTGHSLPTIVQPSLLPLPSIDILPSIPPQHSLQPTISIEQFNTQDRNILHNLQPGSNFQRMSRLNSPYPPVGQPGKLYGSLFYQNKLQIKAK